MFDGRWRRGVDRSTQPLGVALHRTGITANQLTGAGLVLAVGAASAIATGHLILGLVGLVASALPDLLDGPLAKAAGTAGRRGAFLDSVTDRLTDAVVLGGVAWYLASTRGGRAALLAFGVLAAASLVSYERAKAESLGFEAKGGLMERAERVIVLCVGLAFPVLVLSLWVILGGSVLTALQRFVKVWRQASPSTPSWMWWASSDSSSQSPSRWTMAAMEARWRARREAMGPVGTRWRSGSADPGWSWRSGHQSRHGAGRNGRTTSRRRGAGTRP